MARNAQDREDMLRDATALIHRIELKITEDTPSQTVFAGFRANDAASIYFNLDPAYHFNSNGQLRRAFWKDQLVKAEQGQLIALRTTRTDTTVEMLRHEMTVSEQQEFCDTLSNHLQELAESLRQNQYEVTGTVHNDSSVVEKLQIWLHQFPGIQIADTPRVA